MRVWIALISSLLLILLVACGPRAESLRPFAVALSPDANEQMLVSGPPQSAGIVAGRVVLAPGGAMHRHSTGSHEELLIVLRGRGQVLLPGQPIGVEEGQVVYIPPGTEHEVRADAREELRYVFTAAPAR